MAAVEHTRVLLEQTDAVLTLYLRRAARLGSPEPARVRIIEGDVLDPAALRAAMQGQDVVYANLAGDMARQARAIIDAMRAAQLKRLIFISSMGIYGEVPGGRYRSVLNPYRASAAEIEESNLDYTILRPGWFTHDHEMDYRITQRGEPFRGHDVSLDSLSDLIARLITMPGLHVRSSLGISRVRHRSGIRWALSSKPQTSKEPIVTKVTVVIGAGSIGQAIARRVSAGKHVLLADLRQENAEAPAKALNDAGFAVRTATVDVSSRASVQALVEAATALGEVSGVNHAAGVSPSQASPETI